MEDHSQLNSHAAAAASVNSAPRRVSAESFRRLTSLLKKSEVPAFVIPDILAPYHLPPFVLPLVDPVIETPLTIPDYELVQGAEADVLRREIPAPALVAEAAKLAIEAHDSDLPVQLSTTAIDRPPPFSLPEIETAQFVTELPPAPRSSVRRQAKRDEFSEILNVPKTPNPQLTPNQEAEQNETARSLIDMMSGAGAGGGQPHERALAADTLLRMLPRLPQAIRLVLAQRLAMMESPPPFLVQRLLSDSDVTVSGALLEDCMVIADESLFPVIAQGRPDQLRQIAKRRRLSRAVTEALTKVADPSVLLTLVRNAAAEIPQEGFAELALAALDSPELLPALCIRHDLPVHTAFELFWPAPVPLRRYLLTRFLTDSEALTRILRITMQGEETDKREISVEEIGAGLELALSGDHAAAARNIAATFKVSVALIERIFADRQGEALMALLKVAGVSRADLSANLPRLAGGDHALIFDSRNPEELQAVFDQLSFTKARILLTYWDWAATHSGPYATQH